MTSLPRLEGPPEVLRCQFVPLGPRYDIIFDRWLVPRPLSPGNFDITYDFHRRVPSAANVFENTVRIAATDTLIVAPPDGISYHATPKQIFGDNGLAALPFVKFPFS